MIQSSAESEDELCRGAEILFIELPYHEIGFEIAAFQRPIPVSQFFFVARKARSVEGRSPKWRSFRDVISNLAESITRLARDNTQRRYIILLRVFTSPTASSLLLFYR